MFIMHTHEVDIIAVGMRKYTGKDSEEGDGEGKEGHLPYPSTYLCHPSNLVLLQKHSLAAVYR